MSSKQKVAYIFRGAPASGKGTISHEFIKKLTGKVAYLELDALRWGFHLVNRKVEDIGEDEHQLSYENFLSLLENYCRNGSYTLVIEGLFSWDTPSPHGNIQDLLAILEHYNFKTYIFYLKADIKTLWQRNLKREYSVPEKEFNSLYKHITQKVGNSEIVIDTSHMQIDEVLKTLEQYVD